MTRQMKKVLVTGGTGTAGGALIKALLHQGCFVKVFSRSGSVPHGIENQAIVGLKGDILDREAVSTAVKGVDTVFHLAAKISGSGKGASTRSFDAVNVRGTAILLEAAGQARVERVVFYSSISVYGKRPLGSPPADETSFLRPDSDYARSKADAEKLVLSAAGYHGRPLGVVLRVASVYGPSQKKNYSLLIRMVQSGVFISLSEGVRRTLIHDTDLAEAAILAGQKEEAGGKCYNVTDGCVHSMERIGEAIGKALGRSYLLLRVPKRLTAVLFYFISKESLCFPLLSVIRNLIEKMTGDTAVIGRLIQTELGFMPAKGLEEGWQDAVSRFFKKG